MPLAEVIDHSVAKNAFIFRGRITQGANAGKIQLLRNIHNVSGLSAEHDTSEMHIGGTDATAWIVGVKKKGDITIRRFFQFSPDTTVYTDGEKWGNTYFRDWRQSVSAGQAATYLRPCAIVVLNKAYSPKLKFVLTDCYPSRVEWDELNADDSTSWMETVVIKVGNIDWTELPADLGTYVKTETPGDVLDEAAV